MKKNVAWMSLVALFVGGPLTASAAPTEAVAHVVIETSKGIIELELNRAKAPRSVENFLAYAKSGFYNGTIFHRVIPGFMIQGGGFTGQMEQKKTQSPIQNEADNGLPNSRSTLAMARTSDPHSATAQFFINLVDNAALDFQAKSETGWGYAVFGKVTKGMEIVDAIAAVETTQLGPMGDVPVTPIEIKKVEVKD